MRTRLARWWVAGSLLAVIGACGETATLGPQEQSPNLAIADATHGAGDEHFYWLPPLLPDPGQPAGTFDGGLEPTVTICDLTDCANQVLAEYSTSTGPGSETVRVNPDNELYIVNWHTNELGEPGRTYRISVAIDGFELGFVDVQLAETGKDAKNLTTNELIGLKDGRTLPIKFRLEEGAGPTSGPIQLTELIAVDLDGDGKPDIAGKLPGSGEFVWYGNRGSGTTFKPAVSILPVESTDLTVRWRGRAADLDGDGDNDLLLRTLQADEIVWLENGSHGLTWTRHSVAAGLGSTRGMEAADLDQDGDLDILAVAAAGNTVGWYENAGGGTFAALKLIHAAAWPQGVAPEDLDGDGDLDVISASEFESTEVLWYENQLASAGGFGPPQAVGGIQPDPSYVETGDLDGDGDPDIVTRSARTSRGQVHWYENRVATGDPFITHTVVDLGQRVDQIFLRDLDGDGDVDLIVEEEGSKMVTWYENLPTPGFGPRSAIGTVGSGDYLSFPVDLDDDGDVDVLVLDVDQRQTSWFENDGSGGGWIRHDL